MNIVLILIRQILQIISPSLRSAIKEGLAAWEQTARDTDNQWDDVIVDLLQAIFAFED